MAGPVSHHRILLNDANCDISDHTRLTNCIHLKNHMHNKQTPTDRSLRRDLVVLQRSRSMRDPSTSPPTWRSAFAFDHHLRRVENDSIWGNGRRSLSIEQQIGINGHGGGQEWSRVKKDKPSLRNLGTYAEGTHHETNQDNDIFVHKSISVNSGQKDRKMNQKGRDGQDHYHPHIKTLSEQLNEVSFHVPKRSKRRKKIKSTRKTRTARVSHDVASQNEFGHGLDQNVKRAPSSGCGIPWNWSRIHERGKTFFDMAGRNLSCGLSDSKSKKSGHVRDGEASDNSSASTPLLVEPFESHENTGAAATAAAAWVHDYSGELGLFADSLLKSESDIDNDLAYEARRHQNLTQKYTPRTFRDLVGQNLAVQALSNAVAKRKVGFLYAFYGPRGTGKTSSARIFARALNCESMDRPKPCSICDSCVAYDMGKSQNIREVGPVSNFDFESIMDDVSLLPSSSQYYRVFIFDNCDTLSANYWSAISKVIDRAPRKVVVVFVCSSLDVLPNVTVSRCQKFFFPKLKDIDIIYALQRISAKEDLDIDKDALKLIASRSDGSLRDAKMTLEQLSLLGLRISVPLVQQLVGLISDEKLVDLLDLALSADTTNTVKTLREIMESGIEPLAFMSQLATVITDILAGSHDFIKEKPGRRFFRQQTLSKDDMERLCQALKTLSEAEKQLRVSNDKLTWLTAALLQLAPDQQYMLPPSSSADASLHHSPLIQCNMSAKERPRKSDAERRKLSTQNLGTESLRSTNPNDIYHNTRIKDNSGSYGRRHSVSELVTHRINNRQLSDTVNKQIEEIWQKVVDKIQINGMKEFMHQEGKLVSLSFDSVPTVQLMFSSQLTKFKAEKYRSYILQAFEFVLDSRVLLQIVSQLPKEAGAMINTPIILPYSKEGSSLLYPTGERPRHDNTKEMTGCNSTSKRSMKGRDGSIQGRRSSGSGSFGKMRNDDEIVEIDSQSKERPNDGRDMRSGRTSNAEEIKEQKQNSQSIVRSKVSLADVLQRMEGSRQGRLNGWSKQKAVSIAEKLEQQNLKLESRSTSFLCWNESTGTHRKFSGLKIKTKKHRKTLMKFVSCGKW